MMAATLWFKRVDSRFAERDYGKVAFIENESVYDFKVRICSLNGWDVNESFLHLASVNSRTAPLWVEATWQDTLLSVSSSLCEVGIVSGSWLILYFPPPPPPLARLESFSIDFRARFVQLLSESTMKINRPSLEVLNRLQQLHDTAYITAATPAEALHWYVWARDQPLSPTRGRFRSMTGYLLNGPSSIDANLILAYDPAGSTAMFKIMPSNEYPEVVAAVAVRGGPSLVPCTLHSAEKENGDTFCGLLMPKYDRSLFSVPDLILSEAVLLERAKSLLAAVRHMHSVGFVHMDIKEANVFVSSEGLWFLGDFGSAVREGEPITSTTRGLHPELTHWHLLLSTSMPALRKYDLFMLVGLLVRQLDSRTHASGAGAPDTNDPSAIVLRERTSRVNDENLKRLLISLLDEATD